MNNHSNNDTKIQSNADNRRRGYRLADLDNLPEPTWQASGLWATQSLVMAYGESGSCKTFLALDAALSVASGVPFLGQFATVKSPVIYLCGEGHSGVKHRIRAWMKANECEYPNDLIVIPSLFNLQDEQELRDIYKAIDLDLKAVPGLIVVDTVVRYFGGGDENS